MNDFVIGTIAGAVGTALLGSLLAWMFRPISHTYEPWRGYSGMPPRRLPSAPSNPALQQVGVPSPPRDVKLPYPRPEAHQRA